MSAIVRLSKDPSAQAALRDALDKAGAETASPELLLRVLAAAGAGIGGAETLAQGARTSQVAPKLLSASVAAKGISAFAIFVAGAVAGGYAVHQHDARPPMPGVASAALARVDHDRLPLPPPSAHASAWTTPLAAASTAPASTTPERPSSPRRSDAAFARTAPPAQAEARPRPAAFEAPPRAQGESSHAELASLRGIRDAVDAGRPAEAIAAIAAHRAQYPRSVFDQELLLLEGEARWARRDAAACDVLARFSANYPRSLLIPRVEALRAQARCDASAPAAAPRLAGRK